MRAMKLELNSISLIDINGDTVEKELKEMQQAVGGYIETVTISEDSVMIVDEEGMLKNYQHNDLASYISGVHIYGTALIVGVDGEKFTDCPEQFFVWLGQ